jgi:hypothetical protein
MPSAGPATEQPGAGHRLQRVADPDRRAHPERHRRGGVEQEGAEEHPDHRPPNSRTAASAIPLGSHTGAMLVWTNPSANAALAATTYTAASSKVPATSLAHVRRARPPARRSGIASHPASGGTTRVRPHHTGGPSPEPQGSWRNPDPRRGHRRLRPGSESHPLQSCRRPSRGRASQRSRTGTLPPSLATRNPGGPIRPKPGEHGRYAPELVGPPADRRDEPAKYTTLAEDVQYADHRAAADGDHARGNAYAAGASTRRDRHGQFPRTDPWRLPTQGIRGEAAGADRAAPSLPVQCDDYVQDGHCGFPYCRSRRTLPGYQAGGFPPGDEPGPSAREDLGQGRRHPEPI